MPTRDPLIPGDPSRPGRTIFGHPPGLYVLFLTQMWERFSYFGMLALLVLYLTDYMKMAPDGASTIFKWYTSAIYFTPLVGAYLASRWLGNRLAILIGVMLMAAGHFLMAFPSMAILKAALVLLVLGFGLLTPPLTTQVGLLYAPHDPRRDSAYTIFYMGINLGAFLSPLACGWLAENTQGRYHSGFTLAGIGMVFALLTYLLGQRWIREVDQGAGAETAGTTDAGKSPDAVPSASPRVNAMAPRVLAIGGALLALFAPPFAMARRISRDALLFLELAAIVLLIFGWIAANTGGASRDRVLAILLLAIFSVFYWAGAGQAGNSINLWAEQNTDRYLSTASPVPDIFPEASAPAEAVAGEPRVPGFWERWSSMFRRLPRKNPDAGQTWGAWWSGLWNPVPTAWFQSVNPLLILLLAPGFAWLWPWLNRRGLRLSTAVKMGLGLILMALAFAVMWGGGIREARETRLVVDSAQLPSPLVVNPLHQVCRLRDGKRPEPLHAGRLFFDPSTREIRVIGVFPDLVRDDIIGRTAPVGLAEDLERLRESANNAMKKGPAWNAAIHLGADLPGFDLRYAGFGAKTGNQDMRYDPATRTLTTTIPVEDKEIKALLVAAGDPAFRSALDTLVIRTSAKRVSPGWLLGFFLLATLGEMCLSPIGLSMVSQLAPPRFAAMLMGLWLLIWAFGNFIAGEFGEKWGTWPPVTFFATVCIFITGAAAIFFLLSRKIARMMHE